MQKTFIAIALALTLSCAFALYTPIPAGYSKAPIEVAKDGETNFTNATDLSLGSVQIGELDLVASNIALNTSGATINSFYRKLDAKALTGSANTTFSVTVGLLEPSGLIAGTVFAISELKDAGTNISQIKVSQFPINGGAALPVLNLTANTNVNFTNVVATTQIIGKTVYVFTVVSDKKVNITNFAVGGAKGSVETTLTSAYEGGLNTAWGEALGNNQIIAIWKEGGVLKSSTVDVSKAATPTSANVDKWGATYACQPYATDKKIFGTWCSNVTVVNSTTTITYYATTNSSSLVQVTSNANTNATVREIYPYGPYLAVFWQDTTTTAGTTAHSYNIWNLDTLATTKNSTAFLSLDDKSKVEFWRVTSGGLYTLLYNDRVTVNGTTGTLTGVQVGLVLGSSYLATVFGFLMTIIAGLFLF